MPMIYYKCNRCAISIKKIYKNIVLVSDFIDCHVCDGELQRQLKAPNSKFVQTVDGGAQARAVELVKDIVFEIEDYEKEDEIKKNYDEYQKV